jgi:hypothetical protein
LALCLYEAGSTGYALARYGAEGLLGYVRVPTEQEDAERQLLRHRARALLTDYLATSGEEPELRFAEYLARQLSRWAAGLRDD